MYQKNIMALLIIINNTIYDLRQTMCSLSHFNGHFSLLSARLYSATFAKKRHVSASN